MPVGLRSRVPAKMTSCMLTPRSSRADCSPSTHEMASEMFDLPQPFGPTMAAMPSPWKRRSVRSQNDLKPRICSFFSLSNFVLRSDSAGLFNCAQRKLSGQLDPRFHLDPTRTAKPTLLSKARRGQDIKHHIWGYPCGNHSILHHPCSKRKIFGVELIWRRENRRSSFKCRERASRIQGRKPGST